MELNTYPLVSVIIPCYNRPAFLCECLESIANQTYRFIEVILVDDASTEDLAVVVNSINWPDTFSIQYIRLDENRGPGYAREIGRQSAIGDYINYQDSDDLFHPEKIAAQVETLQGHPDAGMCYCITLNFTSYPFDGTETLRRSHYIEKILPDILEKRPWATGSCLWTRTATDAIGPWIYGHGYEDLLYEVRAGCKEIPIRYVPQILMYVRCHSGEAYLRSPSKQKYQQAMNVYQEVLKELHVSGKLNDARGFLAVTREIFRVCQKLFYFQDTETAIRILQYLTSINRSTSTTQSFYFFSAKIILFSRHILPQKCQAHVFNMICYYAMII